MTKRIKVFIINLGTEFELLTPAIQELEISGQRSLQNRTEFDSRWPEMRSDIRHFIGAPIGTIEYSARGLVALVTTLAQRTKTASKMTRLIIVHDDVWPSMRGESSAMYTARFLFADPRWQSYALKNGVVSCLVTHNEKWIGSSRNQSEYLGLLRSGYDLVLDGYDVSPQVLIDNAHECFVRSARHRRFFERENNRLMFWAMFSFLLFGLCTAIAENVVNAVWRWMKW